MGSHAAFRVLGERFLAMVDAKEGSIPGRVEPSGDVVGCLLRGRAFPKVL